MKIKKVLITLVASVGLIATVATVNKNEEQTVKADGQYQDPPKALRGKWYDLNKHDSNYFYILGTKKALMLVRHTLILFMRIVGKIPKMNALKLNIRNWVRIITI